MQTSVCSNEKRPQEQNNLVLLKKQNRQRDKMGTIKEEALSYEPEVFRNISELKKVPVDAEVQDLEGTKKDGTTFKYKAIVLDEIEYRIPKTVLKDLRVVLEDNEKIKFFKVVRTGTDKENTKYTVIPLAELEKKSSVVYTGVEDEYIGV
jgi:ATP:corrinoid adenosyltransferase